MLFFFIEPNNRYFFEYYIFLISLSVSAVNYYLLAVHSDLKTTKIIPKIFAPEQFEKIFKNLIPDSKKLVIAIDNIDRCENELVLELLMTAKNFLDKKNVIFIIPVVQNALSGHLKNVGYNNPKRVSKKGFQHNYYNKRLFRK